MLTMAIYVANQNVLKFLVIGVLEFSRSIQSANGYTNV